RRDSPRSGRRRLSGLERDVRPDPWQLPVIGQRRSWKVRAGLFIMEDGGGPLRCRYSCLTSQMLSIDAKCIAAITRRVWRGSPSGDLRRVGVGVQPARGIDQAEAVSDGEGLGSVT